MTTPTTMTTSMITTATTMMTNVVVAPSLGELLGGCMLLLTGTIVVVVPTILVGWGGEVVPTVWGGEVVPTVWRVLVVAPTVWEGEGVPVVQGEVFSLGIDAAEKKHITSQMDKKQEETCDNHVFKFLTFYNATQTSN